MPELTIYDDIGDFGVTARDVKAQLDAIDGDLNIRINSFGGDVFEGHAIYNLIRGYDRGSKAVHIDGIAASAASIIAMAGDSITMPANAMMMIHDPYTVAMGNGEEMRKTADLLDQVKTTIVNVYAERTGLPTDELSEMMSAETWFDSIEAEAKGFAIKGSDKVILNKIDKRQWLNKLPLHLVAVEGEKVIEPETKKEYPNNDARRRFLDLVA